MTDPYCLNCLSLEAKLKLLQARISLAVKLGEMLNMEAAVAGEANWVEERLLDFLRESK